jgi:FlaA1/EpsC-like NDP-sugar epimerase
MGKPIRIVQLARDLIRLSGLEPEKDIPIVFTGLRPGEKLYEELQSFGEKLIVTEHKRS